MKAGYSKHALKFLSKLEAKQQKRIRSAVSKIPEGDIIPLKGSNGTMHRLRTGNWRIVFSYLDNNTVAVEKIGPRGDVYKGV